MERPWKDKDEKLQSSNDRAKSPYMSSRKEEIQQLREIFTHVSDDQSKNLEIENLRIPSKKCGIFLDFKSLGVNNSTREQDSTRSDTKGLLKSSGKVVKKKSSEQPQSSKMDSNGYYTAGPKLNVTHPKDLIEKIKHAIKPGKAHVPKTSKPLESDPKNSVEKAWKESGIRCTTRARDNQNDVVVLYKRHRRRNHSSRIGDRGSRQSRSRKWHLECESKRSLSEPRELFVKEVYYSKKESPRETSPKAKLPSNFRFHSGRETSRSSETLKSKNNLSKRRLCISKSSTDTRTDTGYRLKQMADRKLNLHMEMMRSRRPARKKFSKSSERSFFPSKVCEAPAIFERNVFDEIYNYHDLRTRPQLQCKDQKAHSPGPVYHKKIFLQGGDKEELKLFQQPVEDFSSKSTVPTEPFSKILLHEHVFQNETESEKLSIMERNLLKSYESSPVEGLMCKLSQEIKKCSDFIKKLDKDQEGILAVSSKSDSNMLAWKNDQDKMKCKNFEFATYPLFMYPIFEKDANNEECEKVNQNRCKICTEYKKVKTSKKCDDKTFLQPFRQFFCNPTGSTTSVGSQERKGRAKKHHKQKGGNFCCEECVILKRRVDCLQKEVEKIKKKMSSAMTYTQSAESQKSPETSPKVIGECKLTCRQIQEQEEPEDKTLQFYRQQDKPSQYYREPQLENADSQCFRPLQQQEKPPLFYGQQQQPAVSPSCYRKQQQQPIQYYGQQQQQQQQQQLEKSPQCYRKQLQPDKCMQCLREQQQLQQQQQQLQQQQQQLQQQQQQLQHNCAQCYRQDRRYIAEPQLFPQAEKMHTQFVFPCRTMPSSHIIQKSTNRNVHLKSSNSDCHLNVGMQITMENIDPVTGQKLGAETIRDCQQEGNIQCRVLKEGSAPVLVMDTDFAYNPLTGMLFKSKESPKSTSKTATIALPLKNIQERSLSPYSQRGFVGMQNMQPTYHCVEPPEKRGSRKCVSLEHNPSGTIDELHSAQHMSGDCKIKKSHSCERSMSRGDTALSKKSSEKELKEKSGFKEKVLECELRKCSRSSSVESKKSGKSKYCKSHIPTRKKPTPSLMGGLTSEGSTVSLGFSTRSSVLESFSPTSSRQLTSPKAKKSNGMYQKVLLKKNRASKTTQTFEKPKVEVPVKRENIQIQTESLKSLSKMIQTQENKKKEIGMLTEEQSWTVLTQTLKQDQISSTSEMSLRASPSIQTLSVYIQTERTIKLKEIGLQTKLPSEDAQKYMKDLQIQKNVNLAIAELCYHLASGKKTEDE